MATDTVEQAAMLRDATQKMRRSLRRSDLFDAFSVKVATVTSMMPSKCFRSRRRIAAVLLAALSPSGIPWAQSASSAAPPSRPAEAAADTGAFKHLRALQSIASANGGNRAAGTPG